MARGGGAGGVSAAATIRDTRRALRIVEGNLREGEDEYRTFQKDERLWETRYDTL